MRHRGGGGRHWYWGKPLSVILSDSIIWWQCIYREEVAVYKGASGHRTWGIC